MSEDKKNISNESEDIIMPIDENDENWRQKELERLEQQEERNEGIIKVYTRSIENLIKAGYSPTEARRLCNDPVAFRNAVNQIKQEAFQEFLETYPGVKPEEIPKEAWQSFVRHGNLVKAFEKHDPFIKALSVGLEPYSNKPQSRDPFIRGFESE